MSEIAKLRAIFDSHSEDVYGNHRITFEINMESTYAMRVFLETIKRDPTLPLTLSVAKYIRQRSQAQNRLLWRLIEIMKNHMNGGMNGGSEHKMSEWDVYLQMLEKHGEKFDYIMIPKESYENFKTQFRATKIVENRVYNEVEMIVVKCFYGSSEMDTVEFTALIEGIMEDLMQLGVENTSELIGLKEEYDHIWS